MCALWIIKDLGGSIMVTNDLTTTTSIMNCIFLFISAAIIIYEVIHLHKIVEDILNPTTESVKNIKIKIFAVFLALSIIGIVASLSVCIGNSEDVLHYSVIFCSFSNMGVLVWAGNTSNLMKEH
jgi:hypothetical protein